MGKRDGKNRGGADGPAIGRRAEAGERRTARGLNTAPGDGDRMEENPVRMPDVRRAATGKKADPARAGRETPGTVATSQQVTVKTAASPMAGPGALKSPVTGARTSVGTAGARTGEMKKLHTGEGVMASVATSQQPAAGTVVPPGMGPGAPPLQSVAGAIPADYGNRTPGSVGTEGRTSYGPMTGKGREHRGVLHGAVSHGERFADKKAHAGLSREALRGRKKFKPGAAASGNNSGPGALAAASAAAAGKLCGGIQDSFAAEDDTGSQAAGQTLKSLRTARGGVRTATGLCDGAKKGKGAARTGTQTVDSAKSAPGAAPNTDGTGAAKKADPVTGKTVKTRVRGTSRAAASASKKGVAASSKAGKAAGAALKKTLKATAAATVKLVSLPLSVSLLPVKIIVLAVVLVAAAVIGVVIGGAASMATVFSGHFVLAADADDDGSDGADLEMHDYLHGEVPPLRAGFIEEIRREHDRNLMENGGDYHFVRIFSQDDEEEIPGDRIDSLVYPVDQIVLIMQPVFWTAAFDRDLVFRETEAVALVREMWGIMAGYVAEELPLEYCGGLHAVCGNHHADDDCPNVVTGTHTVYVETDCCAYYYLCSGHKRLECTDENHGHTDDCYEEWSHPGEMATSCGNASRRFRCTGYSYCQGHRVLAITVRMDGIYALLAHYYTDPIDYLANLSPRTEEEERRLVGLIDSHDMFLAFLAEVNERYGFGGGGTADLDGVDWVTGSRAGNRAIIDIALSQLGQAGGRPYWEFMGFSSRVPWCACFVSWCFDKAGYSAPRFAAVQRQGIPWFQSRGLYVSTPYVDLAPGDVIFFDWQGDGHSDHVGLVIGRDAENVYTVEGNSADSVRIKAYALDSSVVIGYGLPQW